MDGVNHAPTITSVPAIAKATGMATEDKRAPGFAPVKSAMIQMPRPSTKPAAGPRLSVMPLPMSSTAANASHPANATFHRTTGRRPTARTTEAPHTSANGIGSHVVERSSRTAHMPPYRSTSAPEASATGRCHPGRTTGVSVPPKAPPVRRPRRAVSRRGTAAGTVDGGGSASASSRRSHACRASSSATSVATFR